jgi:rhomboid family GlyGly-CTERM serine protease
MSLVPIIKEYYSDIPLQELRSWVAVALLMAVLQAMPDEWRAMLRYDQDALATGEVWRIFSANFIHLGWNHLLLNMAGFMLIGWLFADEAPPMVWFIVLLVCGAASSLGLYWFTPDAYWVVGMSGALHGLFVFGALSWIAHSYHMGWGLLLVVAGKLLWEQMMGAMPLSEGIVGGPVVTDAHLWGAIGGLCAGLSYYCWRRLGPRL